MTSLGSLVARGSVVPVRNLTQGKALETRLDLTPRLAKILLAGGLLAYARAKLAGKQ